MPTELAEWVTNRIVAFPHEAPENFRWLAPWVAEHAGLPLYVGWWDTTAIKADGEIVSWSTEDEFSGYSGVRPVDDPYLWLISLVNGARRYQQLKPLLPSRPDDAVDCDHFAQPIFAEGKVFCPKCCGLGWVNPPV